MTEASCPECEEMRRYFKGSSFVLPEYEEEVETIEKGHKNCSVEISFREDGDIVIGVVETDELFMCRSQCHCAELRDDIGDYPQNHDGKTLEPGSGNHVWDITNKWQHIMSKEQFIFVLAHQIDPFDVRIKRMGDPNTLHSQLDEFPRFDNLYSYCRPYGFAVHYGMSDHIANNM